MHNLTLNLPRWSVAIVVVGDDDNVKISGEPERKGTVDLRLQDPSPFDSFYREAP
jgi:hypothetical protein